MRDLETRLNRLTEKVSLRQPAPLIRLMLKVNDAEFQSLLELFDTPQFDPERMLLEDKYKNKPDGILDANQAYRKLIERMGKIDLRILKRVAQLDD